MPTITAAEVNRLRQQTGAGMMDCRKALIESDGDMEKAIDYLRKKGAKVAALRSDREAREGVVFAITSADGKTGVVLLLSCETDFVAKNQDFVQFARDLASAALESGAMDSARLDQVSFRGATVRDRLLDQVGRIGEKIAVARLERLEAESVVAYNHAGNRVGVLVGLNQPQSPVTEATGKDLAMQVAAMNPIAVDQAEIPESLIQREKEIYVEQVRAEGKPAEIADKIAQGKLGKFFKDSTLLGQPFVKDGNLTVAAFLKSVDPALKVTAFKRVALGS